MSRILIAVWHKIMLLVCHCPLLCLCLCLIHRGLCYACGQAGHKRGSFECPNTGPGKGLKLVDGKKHDVVDSHKSGDDHLDNPHREVMKASSARMDCTSSSDSGDAKELCSSKMNRASSGGLVGPSCEVAVTLEDRQCQALLDIGSMVSTVTYSLSHQLKLDIHPMDHLLRVEGVGGQMLQYLGYVVDKVKTAFIVGPHRFYECNQMPFGLSNAPATFQRLMENCFGDMNMQSCLIYLDDIVVFSQTFEEHVQWLSMVLERLIEAGLKFPLRNASCSRTKSNILATSCLQRESLLTQRKSCVSRNGLSHRTLDNFRVFWVLWATIAGLYKDFSKISHPLYELLKESGCNKKEAKAQTICSFKRLCMAGTSAVNFRQASQYMLWSPCTCLCQLHQAIHCTYWC